MPVSWGKNQPKTVVVVVAVVGTVVVAIRNTAVPGVVVPATTAQHTVRTHDC